MKHCLLSLLLLLFAAEAAAQLHTITTRVLDADTGIEVDALTITLMKADSTVVSQTAHKQRDSVKFRNEYIVNVFPIQLEANGLEGNLILKMTSVGYETKFVPFTIKSSRQRQIDLGLLKMKKEAHQLGEVLVTATRVQMVMHGDTLVFNADAFKLAEGSMLDALIAQLPGAELNAAGEIRMNGRKVDNLLVDGRDFFSGDPKAALKSLPAYTVNKVKVYDRMGDESRMMQRDMGDRQFVMDVRLKRQYQHSWVGDVSAGGGTRDRFSLGLNATRSTSKSTLTVYANANNCEQRAGLDLLSIGVFTPEAFTGATVNNGEYTRRSAYLSYDYGNEGDKVRLSARTNASHNNTDIDTWTSGQTYLAGGDLFSRSDRRNLQRNISWDSKAGIVYAPKGLVSSGDVTYTYQSGRTRGSSLSATFDADPVAYQDILNDVFLNPEKYRRFTLNAQRSASRSEQTSHKWSLSWDNKIKLLSDVLALRLSFNKGRTEQDAFSLNDLRYLKNDGQRDFRNEYRTSPTSGHGFHLAAEYKYALNKFTIAPFYSFDYERNDNENLLYRLDRLSDRDSTVLDMLPSAAEAMAEIIDRPNSYRYDSWASTHRAGMNFSFIPFNRIFSRGLNEDMNNVNVTLKLPLSIQDRGMNYHRIASSRAEQHNVFFTPSLNFHYMRRHNKIMHSYTFDANMSTAAPDLLSTIDYKDSSDPLNTTLGNPNLKNIHTYTMSAFFAYIRIQRMSFNIRADYNQTDNLTAYAFVMDKATGSRVTMPVSVNGNWNVGFTSTQSKMVNQAVKKNAVGIDNTLGYRYSHSVDMSAVAGAVGSERSIVHNHAWTESLNLKYNPARSVRLLLNLSGKLSHVSGDRADFVAFDARDYSIGLYVLLNLPWKLQLSTNLANISHRGYSASEMNTDELIWNAQLSRSFCKNRLSVTLLGSDILGNLSNRQFTVNEQGRTETFTNMLPSYCMLKLSYHFIKGKQTARRGVWTIEP